MSDCGSPPDPTVPLKGHVDGVFPNGSDYVIRGWACHPGWEGSINVHLYVGGQAESGELVMQGTANQSNETAVNEQCGTTHGSHRFELHLSASQASQHQGKAVYVHGISPVQNGNFAVEQSGVHVIP